MATIQLSCIDYTGKPNYDASNNNLNFNVKNISEIITSYSINPTDKSYFEFTITSYGSINNVKYIPLYVGVSKEVSCGVNSNDYCYGSVFYNLVSANYSIIENLKGSVINVSRSPLKIGTKPPIIDDIVGVAINAPDNEISIYINGKLLYSFYPTLFDLRITEEKIYPAIYFPNSNSNIIGKFNFGKSKLEYIPSGYLSANKLYNKSKIDTEIVGKLTVDRDTPRVSSDITGTIETISIKGDGSVYLVQDVSANFLKSDNLEFSMNIYENPLFSNLPLPNNLKIYTELYIRDGVVANKYLGIPISIGLTDTPSTSGYETKDNHFINIRLYHILQRPYQYLEHLPGETISPIYDYIDDLDTIIPAEQGKWIGIEVDPINREITIWINKIKYYTYKFESPFPKNPYLYIRNDDGAFINSIHGIINFGKDEEQTSDFSKIFKGKMPEDCMSLWHYYNKMGHFAVTGIPDLEGEVIVNNTPEDINKYINGFIEVEENLTPEEYEFGNGINRMYKTYSRMSDTDPHNDEPKYQKYPYINRLIAKNNDGYYPDDPNDPDFD